MRFFHLQHSKTAYWADFASYAVAVLVLFTLLVAAGPHERAFEMAAMALCGLVAWTGMEYALHRFVLHGLQPFRRWHEAHHREPAALIGVPPLVSAAVMAALVMCPAWVLGDLWRACAWTLGVLVGYLAYAMTHHATHHWRSNSAWLRRRKHWHAKHHHLQEPSRYGVTSAFWDHVFGTAGAT